MQMLQKKKSKLVWNLVDMSVVCTAQNWEKAKHKNVLFSLPTVFLHNYIGDLNKIVMHFESSLREFIFLNGEPFACLLNSCLAISDFLGFF